MANQSYYLEALIQFPEAATAREVHAKAVEMFGDQVRGDRTSCRLSLDRQVAMGKAEKVEKRYIATQLAYDPIGALSTKARVLETNVRALEKENEELKARLAELEDGV